MNTPNTQDPKEMEKLARECGATPYVNRLYPEGAALAFGPEAWAKFCAALQPASAQPFSDGYISGAHLTKGAAFSPEVFGCPVVLQPAAAQPQGDAREAFEALYCRLFPFASSMFGKFNREGDDYDDANVLVGWRIFQALQAATAQASEPSAEPVAEVYRAHYGGNTRNIGVDAVRVLVPSDKLPPPGTKLYAAPARAVEPLTYEKLLSMWSGGDERFMRPVLGKNKVLAFARAIERAHGITTTPAAKEQS